ncbi:MAG: isoprenylcysteine carboxylmethyltransferase family protein [Anaerolineales bacterium]|nr:isoprenylcysteine carboxylmethyltransferase family protein [Anaerolineales bacterium]
MRRYDRQRKESGTGRAWDFTILILLFTLAVLLQPIFLPGLGFTTAHIWGLVVQLIGLVIVVISLALHVWARLHLGRFYAERVEVLPDHQVIETGPYALVRHPFILAVFGLVAGLLLVVPGLPMLLLAVYTFWDFSRAAVQEEKLLSDRLPAYRRYLERVPRFLPRLWRKA